VALRNLAFDVVPPVLCKDRYSQDESLLDSNAIVVDALLRRRGIPIPRHLDDVVPPMGTLYHIPGLVDNGITYAQHLWDNGFHDIDDGWDGVTPLMILGSRQSTDDMTNCLSAFLEILEFFLLKGADIHKTIPWAVTTVHPLTLMLERGAWNTRPFRAVHKLASTLGVEFQRTTGEFPLLELAPFCINVLMYTSKDPSICECSPGGCRPVSLFLKYCSRGSLEGKRDRPHYGTSRSYQPMKPAAVALLTASTELPSAESHVDAIVRSLTFHFLELTHTCCHYDASWTLNDGYEEKAMISMMEIDEIEEIQQEEGFALQELDFLVEHFKSRFSEFEVSSYPKFYDYMNEKTMEIANNRKELDEDEKYKIREIGVRIQEV
jgi:hypothetical protein